MNIADFVSQEEVKRACKELGIRDWTQLTDTKVQAEEAEIIQATVGAEALEIPMAWFQQGLEVELEHGLQFPDANVTNNHPVLTAKIVLAHASDAAQLLKSYLLTHRNDQSAADGELMAYRHESFWQCMDTQREAQALNALWTTGEAPWKVWI